MIQRIRQKAFGMEVAKVAQVCVVVKKLNLREAITDFAHKKLTYMMPRCTITYPKNDLINFVNEIQNG